MRGGFMSIIETKILDVPEGPFLVLPDKIIAELGVKLGDPLYLTLVPDGFRITAKPPVTAKESS